MRSRTQLVSLAVVTLLVAGAFNFTAPAADAQMTPAITTSAGNSLIPGVKLGLIAPGDVWVDSSVSFSSDTSYSLGGFLDYQLSPRLYGGLFLDINNFSVADESATMFDLGVTLKAHIQPQSHQVTFRPGFGLGLGRLASIEGMADASTYLTVQGLVEMLFPAGARSWLVELAVVGGPAGGNDQYDVTYGPGLRVRGGLAF